MTWLGLLIGAAPNYSGTTRLIYIVGTDVNNITEYLNKIFKIIANWLEASQIKLNFKKVHNSMILQIGKGIKKQMI